MDSAGRNNRGRKRGVLKVKGGSMATTPNEDGPGGPSHNGGPGGIAFTRSGMYISPFVWSRTKPLCTNTLRSSWGT